MPQRSTPSKKLRTWQRHTRRLGEHRAPAHHQTTKPKKTWWELLFASHNGVGRLALNPLWKKRAQTIFWWLAGMVCAFGLALFAVAWWTVSELKETAKLTNEFVSASLTNEERASSLFTTLQPRLLFWSQLAETAQQQMPISLQFSLLQLAGFSSDQIQTALLLVSNGSELVQLLPSALGFDSPQHYIIILQNSDELRATGGFMGSYATLDVDHGRVTELKIRDIYEPDGQFTGFLPAPAGVREYLSGGKGMRLPDTNWSPDAATSVRDMLPFFTYSGNYDIHGVVFLNLSVAEDLLRFTGPVYLPDYDLTVTSENIGLLARADRVNFFPGSQQKPQFLNHLFTMLRLQLLNESKLSTLDVPKLLLSHFSRKDIQFFAQNSTLQEWLRRRQLSGEVQGCDLVKSYTSPPPCASFLWIESNVSINKVNRWVDRDITLQYHPGQAELTAVIHNASPLNPSDSTQQSTRYVTYVRVWVSAMEAQLKEATVNGQPVAHIDNSVITTVAQREFREIGLLVSTEPQASSTLKLVFATPTVLPETLVIEKQSGLPPTPYHIQVGTKFHDIMVEKPLIFIF